jgi:hypothetical protein
VLETELLAADEDELEELLDFVVEPAGLVAWWEWLSCLCWLGLELELEEGAIFEMDEILQGHVSIAEEAVDEAAVGEGESEDVPISVPPPAT